MTDTPSAPIPQFPASPVPATVHPPSVLAGTSRIFELSFGEMLWSRRTVFMALLVLGPVVLSLVALAVQASGTTPLRVNGNRVAGIDAFGLMMWVVFLRFIVPVLGVFYGTALIADEVEDRTITYLFTRPIRRGAVLLGKYLAYLLCTSAVVLPSVVIVYFLLVPLRAIPATFVWFVTDLALLAAGLAVYGGVFALVGAVLKRPLVAGLVWIFGWEQITLALPGYLKRFTVAYHLQSLVPHTMPADGVASLLRGVFTESAAAPASLVWLTAMLAAALVLAVRAVEAREYVLDQ
jgi:ABC-type transport system involved in multi-copper enzyme maturation permease subunit